MSESEPSAAADGETERSVAAGDELARAVAAGDEPAAGPSGDPADGYSLDDLPDGSGCAEIWDHLSDRRRRD